MTTQDLKCKKHKMFEWDLIESCLTRACEEANESSESMFEQKKKVT
jgi:hypothetical protein